MLVALAVALVAMSLVIMASEVKIKCVFVVAVIILTKKVEKVMKKYTLEIITAKFRKTIIKY